ncbi:MAG: hypothetical protein WCI73_11445 [Phycisphaerae bacterium]
MKHLIWNVFAVVVTALFCAGGVEGCQQEKAGRSHREAFSDEGLIQANANQLHATQVTAHMEVPLQPGQNMLWCGSFQLAWNETCTLAGGQLLFRGPQPESVASLNRKLFDATDLDEASYVALAGYVRDGIVDQIAARLKQKFDGHANPMMLPKHELSQRPQDLVAYAYLFKNLEFPVPYERGTVPLPFGNGAVKCFGMGPQYKPGREQMAGQTLIHDYVSADNFVIELQTKTPGERLILAKITPEKTLAQTVAAVQRRSVIKPTPALPEDVLVIPKSNFDITRSYDELCGRHLLPTATGMANDLFLLAALQNTRFQMDETGVRLQSESTMYFGCSAPHNPPPVHRMIFDKPFLIMMSRADAKHPYFALWVANPELLVKAP